MQRRGGRSRPDQPRFIARASGSSPTSPGLIRRRTWTWALRPGAGRGPWRSPPRRPSRRRSAAEWPAGRRRCPTHPAPAARRPGPRSEAAVPRAACASGGGPPLQVPEVVLNFVGPRCCVIPTCRVECASATTPTPETRRRSSPGVCGVARLRGGQGAGARACLGQDRLPQLLVDLGVEHATESRQSRRGSAAQGQ